MVNNNTQIYKKKQPLNKKLAKSLVFWVFIGLFLGVLFGTIGSFHSPDIPSVFTRFFYDFSVHSKEYTIDPFIKGLKLLMGPIIFLTIITGIIRLEDLKTLGSLGFKTVIYFEVVSTFALIIGVFFGEIIKPGHGMHLDIASLDAASVQGYIEAGAKEQQSAGGELYNILMSAIPHDPITPFVEGKTLQVLVMAVLIAIALSFTSKNFKEAALKYFESMQETFFKVLTILIWYSPLATFGAMAFLIAKFGFSSISGMALLLVTMALAVIVFIFGVLGIIAAMARVNIFKFMRFIYREVLVVFATSSSETALAPLMRKLEKAGIQKASVGLVIPTGYSFNLDATNIYLSLAVIFLGQAFDIPLTLEQTITLIIILMVSSKGAVGVTGSGFIVLAGTLSALTTSDGSHLIPAVTVAAILGIDKFLSEMRSVGNLCGNAVACMIVSIWDKRVDMEKFRYALDHPEEFRVL
ncbi:cation:dicarboxylate symporter family transporter [Helicobacter bilis]|uniref:cation:dicarboxylate symporter family transporter n=1 Tax=Helicobacter bilis TaxID=37372 RepID=UPI00051CC6D6|nr:cation:dicarboxylase symporter family transporter [Helicobacter bilis]MDD7296580.1 cation:dicarboxylase symporter family transporter [Helicobacter bilis]MDY4399438.1 cation:dicarboxylase symporter family transporter [Helicobacter bilis]TLE09033.1 cation:dicarboxylase symporter family transporter [Helicobacter bilis]